MLCQFVRVSVLSQSCPASVVTLGIVVVMRGCHIVHDVVSDERTWAMMEVAKVANCRRNGVKLFEHVVLESLFPANTYTTRCCLRMGLICPPRRSSARCCETWRARQAAFARTRRASGNQPLDLWRQVSSHGPSGRPWRRHWWEGLGTLLRQPESYETARATLAKHLSCLLNGCCRSAQVCHALTLLFLRVECVDCQSGAHR